MSLFSYIDKLGISPKEITELTLVDIIRIEKKLKAASKLDQNYDSNKIENLIDVLKKHKVSLTLLYTDRFKMLRFILTNPDKFLVKKNKIIIPNDFDNAEFTSFIEVCFAIEIRQYVDNCIKNDFYNALESFLCFKQLFSPEFLDGIQKKLANKLGYVIECIRISASQLNKKTDCVTNPYFFRSLTKLGAINFNNEVTELLNITIDKIRERRLNMRIIYAMGGFEPVDERLFETIKNNKKIAYIQGVREVLLSPTTKRKTGGTEFNTGFKSVELKPLTAKEKEALRKKKKLVEKSKKVVGIISFFLMLLIVGSVLAYKMSDKSKGFYHSGAELETIYHSYNEQEKKSYNYVLEEEIIAVDKDDFFATKFKPEFDINSSDFKNNINGLNTNAYEIIKTKNIPFTSLASGLNRHISPSSSDLVNVIILNKTGTRIVVQTRSADLVQYLLLEPNQAEKVRPNTRTLRVYMGRNPQMVDYFDGYGNENSYFRFKDVTNSELEQFNEFFNLAYTFEEDKEYEVAIELVDEKIEINITDL